MSCRTSKSSARKYQKGPQEYLKIIFWYLTEEIDVLSLFSKKLSDNKKKNIVKKLQSYQCGELKKGAPTFPIVTKNTKIPSFIGQNS